MVAFDFAFTST